MVVKYFFTILFLVVLIAYSQAQVLNNNGAVGNITSGTVVNGGTVTNTSGTITNSGTLTLTSNLTNSATVNGDGAYSLEGNWTNNGTFTPGSSTVTFNGTGAQTIGGSAITDFNNITIDNSLTVNLAQHENLINTLTINAGSFTTTGYNFTLKSTTSGTARIAAIPGTSNFVGNIIMERYTGSGPTDWRFLSPAVGGATIGDWTDDFGTSGFTGSTDPTSGFVSIYSYNEAALGVLDNGYVAATDVNNSISNGKGFWVYLGPTPVTFEVTGPPNKFAQSPAVTFTSNAGINDDGWNLVANPYPSAINWEAASWTKTNLDNAIYIYNSNTGSYASYVGNGLCTGASVNGGSCNIASQQAFWVKANAASPVLTAVENVKASATPSFLKQMNSPNTSHYPMAFSDFPIPLNTNTIPNSILLTARGNGYADETFIRFMQGANNDFDGQFDAWKLANTNTNVPNFSSVMNDTLDFSINSLPLLTSDIHIPIRLTVPVTGTYTISRDSILMLTSNPCLILEDLATGNMIDMLSNISYSFLIADTTSAPRFILHICDSASTGITQEDPFLSGMNVIYDHGEIYLAFDLPHATDADIHVYDLLGAKILTKNVFHIQKNRIKLDLSTIASGIYVAVMEAKDISISKKIIISSE